jgi:hypothetical protein
MHTYNASKGDFQKVGQKMARIDSSPLRKLCNIEFFYSAHDRGMASVRPSVTHDFVEYLHIYIGTPPWFLKARQASMCPTKKIQNHANNDLI